MISACILTRNEEENISKAITSVVDSVDEIVVVDDSSTDNTLKIAKIFGPKIKIFERALNSNFGEQRNFAISKAKNEWIFMLDADEICSDGLGKFLKNFKNNKYDGYSFLWPNYRGNKLIETPHKLVLFRRYGHYIHELHEKVQGLNNVSTVNDKNIYILHRKSEVEQANHLKNYKRIIGHFLKKYKEEGNKEKIKYFEDHVKKQKAKEKIWLRKSAK